MKVATLRNLMLSVLAITGAIFLWQLANRWGDGRHSLFGKEARDAAKAEREEKKKAEADAAAKPDAGGEAGMIVRGGDAAGKGKAAKKKDELAIKVAPGDPRSAAEIAVAERGRWKALFDAEMAEKEARKKEAKVRELSNLDRASHRYDYLKERKAKRDDVSVMAEADERAAVRITTGRAERQIKILEAAEAETERMTEVRAQVKTFTALVLEDDGMAEQFDAKLRQWTAAVKGRVVVSGEATERKEREARREAVAVLQKIMAVLQLEYPVYAEFVKQKKGMDGTRLEAMLNGPVRLISYHGTAEPIGMAFSEHRFQAVIEMMETTGRSLDAREVQRGQKRTDVEGGMVPTAAVVAAAATVPSVRRRAPAWRPASLPCRVFDRTQCNQ